MFGFSKTKKDTPATPATPAPDAPKKGFFSQLKSKLFRSRQQFTDTIANLLLGKKEIDDDLLEELETTLLSADVGVETTQQVLNSLTDRVARKEVSNPEALIHALKQSLCDILQPCDAPLDITPAKPFVILMVGINGAGKTTTIAKLAHYYKQQGKSVLLAAGDTFRAAAVEQLQAWGERHQIPVIAQASGADSASVVYDALHSAQAKQLDLVIADTAGRLHTQGHLMAELAKIKRVMKKCNSAAPHETLLILDATIGQNALLQAEAFHKEIGLTGVAVTKLDGTAKGGILFNIAATLKLPIRFIGVGEQVDDLQPFNATQFVEALFGDNT